MGSIDEPGRGAVPSPEPPAGGRKPARKRRTRRPPKAAALAAPKSGEDAEFMAIARLITPDPPLWLAEHLRRWSPALGLDQNVLVSQPTRAAVRQELERVENAAKQLQLALTNPAVLGFLEPGTEPPIEQRTLLLKAIADLGRRAKAALASKHLAGSDGKARAGRGRALPPGVTSAMARCALVIAEAWKHFHGKYPGDRNPHAATAADRYWTFTGHKRASSSAKTKNAWRRYFAQLRSPEFEGSRREICRHMRESEHDQRRLEGDAPDYKPLH